MNLAREYDGQYLMIEARPGDGKGGAFLEQEDDLEDLVREVAYFSKNYLHKLDVWRRDLQRIRQTGRRAVIWGAGSKGVAFLTTLNIRDEMEYAVDIDPYKHGTYMAGTGQEIVAPEFLREYRPEVVIVMNPIYEDEIRQTTEGLGLTPEFMCAS